MTKKDILLIGGYHTHPEDVGPSEENNLYGTFIDRYDGRIKYITFKNRETIENRIKKVSEEMKDPNIKNVIGHSMGGGLLRIIYETDKNLFKNKRVIFYNGFITRHIFLHDFFHTFSFILRYFYLPKCFFMPKNRMNTNNVSFSEVYLDINEYALVPLWPIADLFNFFDKLKKKIKGTNIYCLTTKDDMVTPLSDKAYNEIFENDVNKITINEGGHEVHVDEKNKNIFYDILDQILSDGIFGC